MNPGGKVSLVRDEGLSVGEDGGAARGCDDSIKIVVGYNFDQVRAAVGKGYHQRQNLVGAVLFRAQAP